MNPEVVRTRKARTASNVLMWALQALSVVVFIGAGSGKLAGSHDMVELFAAIGIGQWFRYLTGGLELTGALLLLVPSTAVLGAGLLTGVMLGAGVAHLTVLHTPPVEPLVLVSMTAAIGWWRWSQGRQERSA